MELRYYVVGRDAPHASQCSMSRLIRGGTTRVSNFNQALDMLLTKSLAEADQIKPLPRPVYCAGGCNALLLAAGQGTVANIMFHQQVRVSFVHVEEESKIVAERHSALICGAPACAEEAHCVFQYAMKANIDLLSFLCRMQQGRHARHAL